MDWLRLALPYNIRVEQLWQKPYGPWSLKYSRSGPLHKNVCQPHGKTETHRLVYIVDNFLVLRARVRFIGVCYSMMHEWPKAMNGLSLVMYHQGMILIKFCTLGDREKGGKGGRKESFLYLAAIKTWMASVTYTSLFSMVSPVLKGCWRRGQNVEDWVKQIFQKGGRMGSVRLEGAWPKAIRDSKEQALKESHHPVLQLHS